MEQVQTETLGSNRSVTPAAQASLRDSILAASDIESEVITIPQWKRPDGSVVELEVRSMTGLERAQLLKRAWDQENQTVDMERIYPDIIIATAFDPETGEKVFGPADRDALNGKNSKALETLASVGQRLSGMDPKAQERAAQSFPGGADTGA